MALRKRSEIVQGQGTLDVGAVARSGGQQAFVCRGAGCGQRFLAANPQDACPGCGQQGPHFVALRTVCPECGQGQYVTHDGQTCPKGHALARGLTPDEWNVKQAPQTIAAAVPPDSPRVAYQTAQTPAQAAVPITANPGDALSQGAQQIPVPDNVARIPLPGENIGALVNDLHARGWVVQLTEVAAWAPDVRRDTRQWLDAGANMQAVPKSVAQHLILFGDGTLRPRAQAAPPPTAPAATPLAPIVPFSQVPPAFTPRTSHEGDEVSATWGEIKLYPVMANGFTVGPFTMTGKVQPGETGQAAGARMMVEMDKLARMELDRKLAFFRDAFKSAKSAMGER